MKVKEYVLRTENYSVVFKNGKQELTNFLIDFIPYDFNINLTKRNNNLIIDLNCILCDELNPRPPNGYSISELYETYDSYELAINAHNKQKLLMDKRPLSDIIHHKYSILKDGEKFILFSMLISSSFQGLKEEDIRFYYTLE